MVALILLGTGALLVAVIVAIRRLPPSPSTAAGIVGGLLWGGFCGVEYGGLIDNLGMGGGGFGFFSMPSAIIYGPIGLIVGSLVGMVVNSLLAQAQRRTRTVVLTLAIAVPLAMDVVNRIGISTAVKLRWLCARSSGIGCLELGEMYFDGEGVSVDKERGLALIKKGCALRYPEACISLGARYLHGDGVPVDPRESQRYFQEAVAVEDASCRRHADPAGGTGSCDKGAAIYLDGSTGERRPDRAGQLLLISCDVNYDACTQLSDLLLSKENVGLDPMQRERVLARACTVPYPTACAALQTSPKDASSGR